MAGAPFSMVGIYLLEDYVSRLEMNLQSSLSLTLGYYYILLDRLQIITSKKDPFFHHSLRCGVINGQNQFYNIFLSSNDAKLCKKDLSSSTSLLRQTHLHYTKDGNYYVKSWYWLSNHLLEDDASNESLSPGSPILNMRLLKTYILPKLKYFFRSIVYKIENRHKTCEKRDSYWSYLPTLLFTGWNHQTHFIQISLCRNHFSCRCCRNVCIRMIMWWPRFHMISCRLWL